MDCLPYCVGKKAVLVAIKEEFENNFIQEFEDKSNQFIEWLPQQLVTRKNAYLIQSFMLHSTSFHIIAYIRPTERAVREEIASGPVSKEGLLVSKLSLIKL